MAWDNYHNEPARTGVCGVCGRRVTVMADEEIDCCPDPREEEKRKYEDIPDEDFTCFECPEEGSCEYAYDPYNLNGDCLKDK